MKLIRSLAGALVATACCAPALAALGGDAGTVETDRARLKGALHVTARDAYSVHEIQASGGLVVREYLSADGRVFAVSWRGPGIPDLGSLLGSYSAQLAQVVSSPHYNHHQLQVQSADVVVQSTGHTRAYFGRAWAPALLPANFSLKDIA